MNVNFPFTSFTDRILFGRTFIWMSNYWITVINENIKLYFQQMLINANYSLQNIKNSLLIWSEKFTFKSFKFNQKKISTSFLNSFRSDSTYKHFWFQKWFSHFWLKEILISWSYKCKKKKTIVKQYWQSIGFRFLRLGMCH